MDYMSKWVEAIALPSNESRFVIKSLKKHIFTRFGTPGEVISDGGCLTRHTGTSLSHIVFGKACHPLAELKNQAYQAIKKLILDPELDDRKRLNLLNEIEQFRCHTYENAKLYKENTKRWHDKIIVARTFNPGEKLRSKRSSPFEVVRIMQLGAMELKGDTGPTFLVNGQRVKHYINVDSNHEALDLNDE
ncbi:uncharacterized protein LOC114074735 [Solanum pennellii]|uniref:Uncharacterized protein LOC114074735 n=1 Tax=Solanum pennellii TaxID=28526 RepID=A0ABM1UYF6_SOLPN|nr:uncharacterized protein LOC114074735 [Solanum pennellii]